MPAIIGPASKSPEWYAIRKLDRDRKERPIVIGASDAAKACGQSEHGGPLDLFADAIGCGIPFDGNAATRMGNHIERGCLIEWNHVRGLKMVTDQPMFFSDRWSFMACTPDAIATETKPLDLPVDAKLTTSRMLDPTGEDDGKFGEEESDQVPVDYFFQGQQQCAVMGTQSMEFAVWVADSHKLKIYRIERNDEIIESIADAEKELVERILNRDPPEPNWSHENTKRLIRQIAGMEVGKIVELPKELADMRVTRAGLKSSIEEMQERVDSIDAQILWFMQDAQIARFPAGTRQLKRSVIAPQYWTLQDVERAKEKVGQVKKRGHERLTESKCK